ncbi:MAG: DUF5129 domain-containing protein [Corynebacterium sp.]|uniref:DUF5129 domain-containing protein n=1 Tax=Corynebacterium sp. TaxID=1720 RepID=UPI0026E082EA|nr:DUF5129 domain-containing protein [Corynebacterium sp.]MDO5669304.1 DUF5129 domain-containing protein [Corynebacterium sp.]
MRSLLIALLLGIGLLGLAPAASAAERVEVLDLAEELSAADEELLRDRTPGIELPAEVTDVTYILFPENDDNLNDTVRYFGEDSRPDLISAEGDKFAPGALIIAVGLDPRRMGVYCGDDVCDAISFYSTGRQDGILDRMEQPLRDGNWAAGMLEGARAVADPTAVRESSEFPAWVGWVFGLGGAVVGLGAAAWAVIATRRSQARKAREQFDVIQRDYGRVAQELQAIDVRAHSLTSPLANDQLRGQWEEVKSGFLGLNETFDQLDGLTVDSPDQEFRKRHKALATAHEQVTRMKAAEENIETLARMEHGDADIRRRELTEMHEDILAAGIALDDAELQARLERIDVRVLALRDRLTDPAFMDHFADLITEQRIIMEAAQQKLYADSKVKMSDKHHAPALWDSTWRPGYGYGNYVPYGIIHTWHTADVQASQSASSSATTGYSSGGFSGGGASRGF